MDEIHAFEDDVSSDERQHVMDAACWCIPDVALADLTGSPARVVTHRGASEREAVEWQLADGVMACPLGDRTLAAA